MCVCMYLFCLFTPFLSVLFVSHKKNPVLTAFNQQIYDFYKGIIFEKKIHCIVESKFLISVNYSFNQCKRSSCCEHITGVVNIYLYECVSLLAPECAVCVCVFVCVILNQSTSKKPHYV